MPQKHKHITISILEKPDSEKRLTIELGYTETFERRVEVMLPSSQEKGILTNEEILRLPKPMTEDEFSEWMENNEELPESYKNRINKIKKLHNIGEDEK